MEKETLSTATYGQSSTAANGSNKSNFTDEFPLLNTSTSHINRRGQINRVEITKSRGNTRRWRVCEEPSLSNPPPPPPPPCPLLMAQYLKMAYSWFVLKLIDSCSNSELKVCPTMSSLAGITHDTRVYERIYRKRHEISIVDERRYLRFFFL